MNIKLREAIEKISKEKNIPQDVIINLIEKSLLTAYKKNFGDVRNVVINIDRITGEINIKKRMIIVDVVQDPEREISLKDASKYLSDPKINDEIYVPFKIRNFSTIAAQVARKVLVKNIKDIEREAILEDYAEKQGRIVIPEVIKEIDDEVILKLSKIETILKRKDKIPGERFRTGQMIKVLVMGVKRDRKFGNYLWVSRTVPEFVQKLLIDDTPELQRGIVEIVTVAREPGFKTKIAVKSNDPNIDPVGSCVGENGERIKPVVKELNDEKVEIIKWSDDPKTFIKNALQPATVLDVFILDPNEKTSRVIVPEDQLSLAIGKGGKNVTLAVKLSGWGIDIKTPKWLEDNNINESA
jgi:N utilization substance protein A